MKGEATHYSLRFTLLEKRRLTMYHNGMTYREIAYIEQVTRNAIHQTLSFLYAKLGVWNAEDAWLELNKRDVL